MNPLDRTLIGHSFGALFGAYVLFTASDVFGRYLLSSPSLWWDDCLLLRTEVEFAATHDDLPARVFLSVGEYEDGPNDKHWPQGMPHPEEIRLVPPVQQLHENLASRDYASLRLSMEVFAGEDHATVFPSALTRGLRTLFP